jgi:hypothetical protein
VRDRAIEIVARHLGARLAALRANEEARELPRAG